MVGTIVVLSQYEAVPDPGDNQCDWVRIGQLCLYRLKKVEICSGVISA